jgi:predicted metal-dependent HD superfamily phosphohydrolase
MDLQRWIALCARLGCRHCTRRFGVLESSYAERHRHYHTANHLQECLLLFQAVADLADSPDELEFAIWLHDVIYQPRRTDNEERSAKLAATWLSDCQVDDALIDRVRRLIASTRHTEPPGSGDEALLQDIDLGVLGSPPQRYAEYEAEVRREYWWVPSFLFRRRRAEILESFLRRDAIYRTPWFVERLELTARRNVSQSVAALRSGV